MAQTRDFYEVLGVARDATQDQIKAAYRRLAVRYHPDKNPGDKQAEERFKELAQAYAALSDPAKRQAYDQRGRVPFDQGGFEGYETFGSIEEILRRYGDLFGEHGGPGGGFGGGFGPFARRGRPVHARGRDTEAMVEVDFRTAALGGELPVAMPSARDGRTVTIRVPAGADDETTLRLRGMGTPGLGGGPPGDLLLRLRVRPDPTLRRRGDDVEADLPVPAPVAALGGRVAVRTLKGEATVNVPAGTSSGTLLRLKGQGIRKGDHLARVMITVPPRPTEAQRDLYRRLQELDGGAATS